MQVPNDLSTSHYGQATARSISYAPAPELTPGERGHTTVLPFPGVFDPAEDRSQGSVVDFEVQRSEEGWDVCDCSCRAVNIFAALVGLVLTLPIMLLIAVAVKLSSPGPVLYTQERVGVDRREGRDRRSNGRRGAGRRDFDTGGRIFTIYKFRTMRVADSEAPQVWASPDDPRITRVGSLLRKTRLDELPQLWNVLKGDMNIVGPRPEQPEIFSELRTKLQHYPVRQRVLPGITGWAQVNHGYDKSLEDVKKKVDLDLEYIRRRSALEDLRIMAMTVPVMLSRRGSV